MRRLYIEAPCFGFGPISTSISIAKRLDKDYEIVFITYEEALDYLKECSTYNYLEIDTRREECFHDLLKYITINDFIIVNTNVELSTFLLKLGYKVLVIDTLYWMWNEVPEEYKITDNFIAQVYYGEGIGKLPKKEESKPIIDYGIWKKSKVQHSESALISFGGMSEPVNTDFLLKYAQLMIDEILKNLPDNIQKVYVVGGLFTRKKYEYNNKCVEVFGMVNNCRHKELVDNCKYLFFSPGLTSIYEMLTSERLFCLLPGLCVSQIYQVYDFKHSCNYSHCIMWNESKELVEMFSKISELEGLEFLKEYLENQASLKSIDFGRIISKYISSVNNEEAAIKQEIMDKIYNHKSIDELVTIYLERMGIE